MTHRAAKPTVAYDAAAVLLGVGIVLVVGVTCTVGAVAGYTLRGLGRFCDAVHGWRKRRGHFEP
jgi:hypothetical protein